MLPTAKRPELGPERKGKVKGENQSTYTWTFTHACGRDGEPQPTTHQACKHGGEEAHEGRRRRRRRLKSHVPIGHEPQWLPSTTTKARGDKGAMDTGRPASIVTVICCVGAGHHFRYIRIKMCTKGEGARFSLVVPSLHHHCLDDEFSIRARQPSFFKGRFARVKRANLPLSLPRSLPLSDALSTIMIVTPIPTPIQYQRKHETIAAGMPAKWTSS